MEEFIRIRKWRKFLFRAPSPLLTAPLGVLISFVFPFDLEGKIILSSIYLLFSVVDFLVLKLTGNYFPARRTFLLNLFTLLIALPLSYIYEFIGVPAMYSLSCTPFLKYLTLYTIGDSTTAPLLSSDIALASGILVPYPHIIFYLFLYLAFLIFSMMVIRMMVSEFKRGFGESPIHFLKNFINLTSNNENLYTEEIEKFFVKIGEERVVELRFLYMERSGEDLVLAFPDIHPGPFGEVGGSNLPAKFQRVLNGEVMVFHTATTHDDNASSTDEVIALTEELKKAIEGKKFKQVKGFGFKRADSYIITRFGNFGVVCLIPINGDFDDVYISVSQSIRKELKKFGLDDVAVVDTHTNYRPDNLPLKTPPSISEPPEIVCKSILTGYCRENVDGKSVGPMGVQVLSIKCSDKKYSLILVDGNNMVGGLREKILSEIKDLVDDAEVFTTDNHITNITTIDELPVGTDAYDEIVNVVRRCVKKSLRNLKKTDVYYGIVKKKMHVAGEGHMQRMGSIATKAARRTLYASIIGFIFLSVIPIIWPL